MDTINFIAYNLDWKSDYFDRLKIILEVVQKKQPTLIIFQNVRLSLYEKFGREFSYLGYKKYLPDNFQNRKKGDIVFSKFIFDKIKFIEFQKNTDKRGIFILSSIEKNLSLCIVCLDSISYLQKYQLSNLNKILEREIPNENNFILAIDTSSMEYSDINTIEGWYDAWYEVGTSENKFTLDFERNSLTPKPYQDRPDRVWYKGKTIECNTFNLIGYDLGISSHLGIECNFAL
jgi:hypothetical protein